MHAPVVRTGAAADSRYPVSVRVDAYAQQQVLTIVILLWVADAWLLRPHKYLPPQISASAPNQPLRPIGLSALPLPPICLVDVSRHVPHPDHRGAAVDGADACSAL